MPSKVYSAATIGLNSEIIEVETDVSYGLKSFTIVGLPDKAVEESRERVSAAIKNSGFRSPYSQPQRILVNLAPADLKKEGSIYDLPIALGYLISSKQAAFSPEKKILIGELSLDGRLKPLKGAISFALAAKEKGYEELILPKANALEAAIVSSIKNLNGNENSFKIIGVASLKEAIDHLEGKIKISPLTVDINDFFKNQKYHIDLDWIKGQESSKRALEITAAGGHNLLMQGPPGTGKSLLASSLPSILPPLSIEESLDVTKIYSVSGLLPPNSPLIISRPFRAPHHTSSEIALIGGGNPPRPGEITLAHRGILFLDEFPEFHRDILESLRQPIEEGKISILRSKYHLSFPSRFTLVAAANPCPCGYYNDPNKSCSCSPSQIAKYRRKLSGPLIDRIDLLIEVPALKFEKLSSSDENDYTLEIRKRVENARRIQQERFLTESKILLNSEMQVPEIKKYCQIDAKSKTIMAKFIDSGKLSARGYHRVLKVARTIADLENSNNINYYHLTEALMYRIREN